MAGGAEAGGEPDMAWLMVVGGVEGVAVVVVRCGSVRLCGVGVEACVRLRGANFAATSECCGRQRLAGYGRSEQLRRWPKLPADPS